LNTANDLAHSKGSELWNWLVTSPILSGSFTNSNNYQFLSHNEFLPQRDGLV